MAIKYLAGDRLQGTAAERAAMTTEATPTWTADLSTNSGNSAWSAQGTARILIDTDNSELDYYVTRGNNDAITFDLRQSTALDGSDASDTAWVLRMQIDVDNINQPLANGVSFAVGLSSHSSASAYPAAQDSISLLSSIAASDVGYNNAVTDWMAGWSNNQNTWGTTQELGDEILATGTWYVEIKRTSATDATISVTTSSDYTTGASSHSFTNLSGVADLRYFKFSNNQGGSTANYLDGSVTSIRLWNGVTTIDSYPNLPNGAIFEESDGTGKHYMFDGTSAWNEVT